MLWNLGFKDAIGFVVGGYEFALGEQRIEITDMQLTLVKWKMATRPDLSLFVAREVLIGPVGIT